MEPKKLKRMIYVYEENVEFYDSLENKSSFINDMLFAEQRKRKAANSRIDYVKETLARIEKEKRVAQGLDEAD